MIVSIGCCVTKETLFNFLAIGYGYPGLPGPRGPKGDKGACQGRILYPFGLYVTKLKIKLLYHPLRQPTAMLYTSHMSVLPSG